MVLFSGHQLCHVPPYYSPPHFLKLNLANFGTRRVIENSSTEVVFGTKINDWLFILITVTIANKSVFSFPIFFSLTATNFFVNYSFYWFQLLVFNFHWAITSSPFDHIQDSSPHLIWRAFLCCSPVTIHAPTKVRIISLATNKVPIHLLWYGHVDQNYHQSSSDSRRWPRTIFLAPIISTQEFIWTAAWSIIYCSFHINKLFNISRCWDTCWSGRGVSRSLTDWWKLQPW